MSRWFIRDRGRVLGPFNQDEVLDMIDRGQVKRYHECSTDRARWRAIDLEPAFGGETVGDSSPRRSSKPQIALPPQQDDDDEPVAPTAAGSNKLYRYIVGGGIATLVLGLVLTVVLVFFVKGKKSPEPNMDSGVVSNFNKIHHSEQPRVKAETVGLILTGVRVKRADGSVFESGQLSMAAEKGYFNTLTNSGTGFVVTKSGMVITNLHVIKDILKYAESEERKRVEDTYKYVITPKIWMFFGRDTKCECELKYQSPEYDLAILDTKTPRNLCFALCDTLDPEIPSTMPVTAIGFPANDRLARQTLSGQGKDDSILNGLIQHKYDDADFVPSTDKGDVRQSPYKTKVKTKDNSAPREAYYLNHSARTGQGNSGGPLLDSNGTVVGINNLMITRAGEAQAGQNYALTMAQLRKEIDRHVDGVVWRKHSE